MAGRNDKTVNLFFSFFSFFKQHWEKDMDNF